jgi:MFS transporter, ACS family, glucarate transporter
MPTDDSPLPQRLPWFVVIVLFCLSCASFGERVNISVAAEVMMPALSLNKAQIGLVFNAFLIGYAIFQVPAGWLGDRLGARVVLGWSALSWAALTALCGLLPGTFWTTIAGTITVLWLLRFFLGAAEASTYPVAAQAIHRWLPPASRGVANSIMLMGSSVAAAVTAPFVSWILPRYGWRASFYFTASVALAASLLWFRITRRLSHKDHVTVSLEENSAI